MILALLIQAAVAAAPPALTSPPNFESHGEHGVLLHSVRRTAP